MWLDGALAYLHFSAMFVLFAFLTVEVMLARGEIDARAIRLLARVDLWYFGSAIAAVLFGVSRAAWGAKGWAFYSGSGVFWAKVALVALVALVSVRPTLDFIRWRRRVDSDAGFAVPERERARLRRYLMIELHLLAIVPLLAVAMARGLG
jgi:putative membrane protein